MDSTARAHLGDSVNEVSEEEEQYLFIPASLRHHFKADVEALLANEHKERDTVRNARRTRSALVVSSLLSAPPHGTQKLAIPSMLTAPTKPLYSQEAELAMSTRVAFDRSASRLEEYISTLTERLRQLEESSPVLVPPWIDNGGITSSHPLKLPTLLQVQRQIVNACHSCLSDCDIYLAMLDSLPAPPAASPAPLLRFVACSQNSSMLNRVLPCSLKDHESAITQLPESNHSSVSVKAIQSKRPVVIEDVGTYVGQTVVTFSQSVSPKGPFACFPLVSYHSSSENQDEAEVASKSYAIGVLSLDSCRKAERQRAESMTVDEVYHFLVREKQLETAQELRKLQINGVRLLSLTENDVMRKPTFQKLKISAKKTLLELIQSLKRGSNRHLSHNSNAPRFFIDDPAALAFLSRVSQSAGVFLDGYRTVHWSREMAGITRNPACSVYDVFEALIRGVAHALPSVRRVTVWKIVNNTGEICAIASTEVPEDRLGPFLRWEERMIRRVALYKECDIPIDTVEYVSNDSKGLQLVQGGVIKSVSLQGDQKSGANTQSGSIAPLCENATFNVAWVNRTYQSLSWRQLRQLLPIRSMNPKHYQLKTLMCEVAEHSQTQAILSLKDPNALVLTIQDEFRPKDATYVLETDFSSDMPPDQVHSPATVAFLRRAVAITERSISCVHGRTRRRMRRERSIATLASRFGGSNQTCDIGGVERLKPSLDALRDLGGVIAEIFQDITNNLPGADIQIAELQPDGSQLKYTFVGGDSTVVVEKTTLQRGQGISFKCLDSKAPLVVDPILSPDLYRRLHNVSSGCHVRGGYDASTSVFIPLVHEECLVGVLSVDSFQSVPKGRHDESHPELGVVDYLQSLGGFLATEIYFKRRSHALYKFEQQMATCALMSPHQLYLGACQALQDVMIGSWKVRLVEIDCIRGRTSAVFDYSEAERLGQSTVLVRAVEPLRLRQKELLPDTITEHVLPSAHTSSDATKIQSAENLIAAVEGVNLKDEEQHNELRVLIASRSSLGLPLSASDRQRVENQRIRDTYFWLLKPDEEVTSVSKRDAARMSSEKYTAHALGLFLATKTYLHSLVRALGSPPNVCVFLVVSCLPQFHAECDYIYVSRVAELLSRGFETCQTRVERSRLRVAVAEQFYGICEQEVQRHISDLHVDGESHNEEDWCNFRATYRHRLSPKEELEVEALLQLQYSAIELIQSVLHRPNVYIGLFEPSRDRIRYTSASTGSVMRDKQLKRGVGVSFRALDRQVPVIIARSEFEACSGHSLAQKPRFFSNGPQKWPFIVVPIGHFGVLALDNLEKYERLAGERQPELGMVDFLRRMATMLGNALTRVRRATRDYRRMLRTKSLLQIMSACEDRKRHPGIGVSSIPATASSTAPLLLLHYVVKQLERALNGVNVYVGLVDPLSRCIRFVCASPLSSMEGKTINADRSVSFQVYASQTTFVIHDLRAHYRALVESQRLSVPASVQGLSPKWLRFFTASEPSGAFVCVPIPYLGVLSVDTFPGAASGLYSPVINSPSPPEDGVVEFLEQAATLIGENIRIQRANALHAVIPTLFHGNGTSFLTFFHSLLPLLAENLPAAVQFSVLQLPKDYCCQDYNWSLWAQTSLVSLSRSKEDGGTCDQYDTAIAKYLKAFYRYKCKHCDGKLTADDMGNSTTDVLQLVQYPEVIIVHCAETRDVSVDVEDDDADRDLKSLRYLTIVIKRVEKATWSYDLDLLNKILPAINSLIKLINPRVQGIVRRRMALEKLKRMGDMVDEITPGSRAVSELRDKVLPEAMELMARAMSDHDYRENPCCDVYLGERSVFISGISPSPGHPTLKYIAASKGSLMEGVMLDLSKPDVQTMITLQVLEKAPNLSQPNAPCFVTAVHIPRDIGGTLPVSGKKTSLFFPRGGNHAVKQLTTKQAQRVLLISRMSDDYVLCADSLSVESLTLTHQVEPDVIEFFQSAARTLLSIIQSTRWRASFDEMTGLRYFPHSNPREFFGRVLSILRRDLVRFHSVQILRLGEDFTCDYECRAWLGAPTRRHSSGLTKGRIKKKTFIPEHICCASDCSRVLLDDDIHFESRVLLPMSNLPRTLDQSRSTQQPAEGVEKRGAFATSCLATMLDASVIERRDKARDSVCDARWALCVYHHDAVAIAADTPNLDTDVEVMRRPKQRNWQPTMFSPAQRRYFFAFSAVAADVFVDVWRSCVLDSSALEVAFVLLEQTELSSIKELAVVRVVDTVDTPKEGIADEARKPPRDIEDLLVLFSTIPNKHASGKAMKRGKLASRLTQFHLTSRSNDVGVFMTRKIVSEQDGVAVAPTPNTTTPTKTAPPTSKSMLKPESIPPVKPNEPAVHRQRGGTSSLFGGRSLFKKRKPETEAPKPPTPSELAVQTAAASLAPRQPPPISLYVLLRVVSQPKARCTDYVLMILENTTVSVATPIEASVRKVKNQIDVIFEESGVGSSSFPRGNEECNAKRFCTKPNELKWCDDSGGGGFLLLGLLKEARKQMQSARVPLEVAMREVLLETHSKTGTATPAPPLQDHALKHSGEHPSNINDMAISIRAALAAVAPVGASGHGFSRDQLVTMPLVDLCREFLRLSICDVLLALDPTERQTWGSLSRARALLNTSTQISTADTTTSVSMFPGSESSISAPISPKKRNEGVAALLELLNVNFAVVRYLRHLEAHMTRARRDTLDAPANIVQCAYRCSRARRQLAKRRHEYVAALTIQCAFRQHLARRAKLFREWTRAAVRIQHAFRSWRIRRLHGGRLLASKMKNELRTIAEKLKANKIDPDDLDDRQDDGMWGRDMAAFETFAAFTASRVGKSHIKREEAILHKKRHAITTERTRSGDIDADSIMWAELGDVFELLDEQGDGELSRDRVLELIKIVHIPLDASEAEDVVAMMDSDRSGAISLQEFSAWLSFELPGLRRRSKECGRLNTRDWQWVIHESAIAALRKRWKAMRIVAQAQQIDEGSENMEESVE